MRTRLTRTSMICAVLAPALLTVGACGSGGTGSSPVPAPRDGARLYGADGNMSNSFGDAFKNRPGVLFSMKGTTPLTQLPADFKNRLRGVDPQLVDYNYAGESYDAAAIAAIAAEYARTTDPQTVARYVVGVTTGGTVCATVAACLALAREGQDLQYRGVSMRRSGLTDKGEPSSATYGTVSFARDNHLDDSRTEFIGAGDEKTESRTAPPPQPGRAARNTAPLRIGGLLPHTGRLAIGGPPLFAGVRLAINDVNAAGGVLGAQVVWVDGDDGTSPQVAQQTVAHLIEENVQVIIGAGASGITKAVLPQVRAAGRILISPTATSDELTTIDDGGMFFRTAPPDILQAKALADVIMRDGPRRVAIVAIDDPYGLGLQDNVQSDLVAAGIGTSDIRRWRYPVKDRYDPERDVEAIFAPVALEVKSFNPDAILVIGSDESAYFIQALLKADIQLAH